MSGPPTLARLERILLMVPWLLEHPGATLAEIAERFGGDPDDVAADLDTLGYCGVPGYGGGDLVEVAITGDRVTVRMAEFFRRPLALTVREATTLLLAGRSLVGLRHLDEHAPLRRAVAKLEAATGAGRDTQVAIDLATPGEEFLPQLRGAIERSVLVRLVYRSASKAETTERDVEPWGLVATRGAWYLQGWCRLATAPRDFRLDRIRELTVTDAAAPARPADAPPGPPVYEPGPDDLRVVVDLEPPAWWVAEWLVCDTSEDRGDVRRVAFRVPALAGAARLVLGLAGTARVIEPPELVAAVIELASASRERYGGRQAVKDEPARADTDEQAQPSTG